MSLTFFNKFPIILCLSFFVFSPILVFADDSIATQNGDKIYITVKPNNTIIVQPPDNSKLNELLQQLSNNESKVIKGDTLISSSTIVGFFGFGSFVSVKLKGTSIGRQGRLMQLVYLSSFTVVVLHLIVIYDIVIFDDINPVWYTIVIVATIVAAAVIAFSISAITGLHVRDAILKEGYVNRLHMQAERFRRLQSEQNVKEVMTGEETKAKTNNTKITREKSVKVKTESEEKRSPI
jgi:hypothetical protein